MLRSIAGALALLYAVVVFGQTKADTVRVYFEVNRDVFNPELFDNATVMERFIEKVDSAHAAGSIRHIDVYGYSSPEGSRRRNQRLSNRRCRTIADYIVTRTGVDPQLITARGCGETWDDLRTEIEATPDVPMRSRVLDIIDNTPEWIFDSKGRVVGGRKKQLMDLAGGRPYRWLLENVFPKLRYALTVSMQYEPDRKSAAEDSAALAEAVDSIEVFGLECSADNGKQLILEEPIVNEVAISGSDTHEGEGVDMMQASAVETPDPIHRLAIKTNMLYYALLLPNLEVEYLINHNWSVALEGDLAWWGKYSREKSYRLAIVSPEVKRWIRPRAPWHGLYVGAFVGAGLYDLENGKKGYYGEGIMGGFSVGYMWPVSTRLSLEAEIGVGYLYSKYKEYRPMDGHHVYQRTKDLNYVGPLKLKLSLVWRLWDLNNSKRHNSNKRNDRAR
ncbi:MAG: DUF3575 domain-containing protein [Muribaculaceae bacterium]|nr:DUF3575 domain-containing protein [Muribaculaceae bacterium]